MLNQPEDEQVFSTLFDLCRSSHATPKQVQDFIDLGADVNAKNNNGSTPLHYAALSNKSPEVLTLLIDAGADVNATNERGETPLSMAYFSERRENVRVLLRAGGERGTTRSMHERKNTHWKPSSLFDAAKNPSPGSLERVLRSGLYDVNATNGDGETPLHFVAIDHKDSEAITVLIDAGADVNVKATNGNTPLHRAARRNANPEVITTLIKAGADVNAKDEDGNTPLHHAAAGNESPEVLSALIEAGADVNATNHDTTTPLHLAIEFNGNPEIATLLTEAGGVEFSDKVVGQRQNYAAILTACWRDNDFRDRLVSDPKAVLADHGVVVPAGLDIKVLQNTDDLVHITMPALLGDGEEVSEDELIDVAWGIPPCSNGYMYISGFTFFLEVTSLTELIFAIREDAALKDRLMSQPSQVLGEYYMKVPDGVAVKVVENTEHCVHVTIPSPPSGHSTMTNDELVGEAGGFLPPSRL